MVHPQGIGDPRSHLVIHRLEAKVAIPKVSLIVVQSQSQQSKVGASAVDRSQERRHLVHDFPAVGAPSGGKVQAEVPEGEVFECVFLSRFSVEDGTVLVQMIKYVHKLFYNNKFLAMTDCPLCNKQFTIGYQHSQYLIIICSSCYATLKHLQRHRSFTRYSLFRSALSTPNKKANLILRKFKDKNCEGQQQFLRKGLIDQCFKPASQSLQKTERFSLTTEDTDPEGMTSQQPKTTKTIVIERCQQKVLTIAAKIEPAREKLLKAAQAVKESANSLRQRYRGIRSQYRNLRAELPPLEGLAREAKGKLSSLFKLF